MTLAETGQVYVTLAAARAYSEYAGIGVEAARRRLTELLLDARRKGTSDSGAENWRRRSNTYSVDVSALVAREGPLAVVIHVHLRDYG